MKVSTSTNGEAGAILAAMLVGVHSDPWPYQVYGQPKIKNLKITVTPV